MWTVAAVASINVLLGYLVALAVWPMRTSSMDTRWLVGLGLAGITFLALAVLGWMGYLRRR